MPRRRSEWTTETILLAAQYEFAENGYQGASYGRIAARAGLDKGLVSHHFARKQDLALAIVERASRESETTSLPLEVPPYHGLEGVIACARRVARNLSESSLTRASARLMFERSRIPADLPNPAAEWVNRVEHFLRQARDDGDVRAEVDPRQEAVALVALFAGFFFISGMNREGVGERAVDAIHDALERIAPSSHPARQLNGEESSVTDRAVGREEISLYPHMGDKFGRNRLCRLT